ncbi:hypothetical protein [Xanthomonas vesicatoria]|uniref:Competence protein CoiA nuclease-like domain-containing protein n=1 Tax=Xanthomonas vesicatoria TaxID=56460 RepID=A0ABS8LFQ7_9XANT|nr:hypothetical protein [Xanthomonas vesicatoria]MCC8624593.1 hypothetical protein [Xanthomonas vesicatoria]MCC8693469.1 hypothetical protein [Xanthomonas vesicatoria]MCC8703735.1 hypothetical protein [Xanthomonas vesicatoria]
MEKTILYVPASKRSHDLVWDRNGGECLTLNAFMDGRDYGEVIRDGRLAAELEVLDGTPRFTCPHCQDAMGVRSKAIRARSEFRFYFDHLTARYREACTGRKGHSPQAIVARRFGLCKEGALHKAFKEWVRESLEADLSFQETKLEERWWDIDGVKWRQPDVQTQRDGQKWAIEIQLSTTFVHVIAERMRHYRKNGGRMLWLFKELNLEQFRLSEDDLFFANNRNAFRVTPATVAHSQREGRFYLEGVWLEPRLENGTIRDVEVRQEIPFEKLIFDTCSRGISRAYAFDYERHRAQAETDRLAWQEEQVWGRRRETFETFYVAMLRGELVDYKERDRRWGDLRRSFAHVGIALPLYAKGNGDLERLLVIGYSIKHGQGRPIGIGFETLAELGHHAHKVWPKSLWFYRCMLRAHGQLKTVLPQDRTAKLQGKMKSVLASLAKGESTFEPDRSWDALLVRLFPEVARLWVAEPGQVAKTALTTTKQDLRTEESPSWNTAHR